jgi:hypothetical protein
VNFGSFTADAVGKEDARWWRREDPEEFDRKAHEKMIPLVQRIRRNQDYRKRADLLHASLYGAVPIEGFAINAYARTTPGASHQLSLNVCKNMVKAVTSKIAARSRPRPRYVTEGGSWEKQENAEKLERGVDGIFYRQGMDRKSCIIFRDSAIFGTGFAKVYPDYDTREVCIDRTFPWEMVVDDTESIYGAPRSLFQRKYYDKRVLAEMYSDDDEKVDAIERATIDREDAEYGRDYTAEQVLVTEGWHLRSSTQSTDGRRTIAIDQCTLEDEVWAKAKFPFARLPWDDPLIGFFGVGLVEDLSGIQTEINKLLREIQNGMHLIKGHYLVENGSKVVTQHINNDLASIVKYTGIAPQYVPPAIIAPEVYQHLWALYQRAYEITGISQLAAQSQKPAGLDSGAALREYNDQQTERFLELGQAFERWTLEVGELAVDAAKDLAKDGGYVVKALSDDAFETIDWRDVELDDGYEMKVFPASQLPSTPVGRMQFAQDMLKLGEFEPAEVLEAIHMPDVAGLTKRKLAPRKLIEKWVGRMVNRGEYHPPEPMMNLALARQVASEMYLEFVEKDVPDDRLELVRQFIVQCDDMTKPPPAPPAPPAQPPGAPPPGPMPPPGGPPMPPGPPTGGPPSPPMPPPPGANGVPPMAA